jgi:hypothetical protein
MIRGDIHLTAELELGPATGTGQDAAPDDASERQPAISQQLGR